MLAWYGKVNFEGRIPVTKKIKRILKGVGCEIERIGDSERINAKKGMTVGVKCKNSNNTSSY